MTNRELQIGDILIDNNKNRFEIKNINSFSIFVLDLNSERETVRKLSKILTEQRIKHKIWKIETAQTRAIKKGIWWTVYFAFSISVICYLIYKTLNF